MTDSRIDILINSVRASKAPDERDRTNRERLGFLVTQEEERLIKDACAIRDISVNAFMRRAVLAFAAQTTGRDYYHVIYGSPPLRTYHRHDREGLGGTIFTQHRVVPDSEDGKGQGEWRIKQLG